MVTSLFLLLCSLSQSTALEHHRNEYSVPKIKEIKKLSDRLLSNYSKHILPFEGPWPFVIDIHVYLVAVGDIDEIDQKLSTVMGLEYEWTDKSFKWNERDNNISYVMFGWQDVWKPIFRVENTHANFSNSHTDRTQDSIIYDSKGLAFFDEMMITRTTCNLDMSFYPFDVQTCDIKLSIVGNSKFHFHLKTSLKDLISHSGSEHGSWRLIEASKTSFYGTLKIVMKFERKSLFIMLHILLPLISIAFLTPTVFVLPKKSGERLSFSVAMLLAVSVYMTVVSYHLPQKAEPLPLILILVCIWYVMDAVIVFIVIVNTKIYKLKNDGLRPMSVRKFVHITHVITCRNKKHADRVEQPVVEQKSSESENNDAAEKAEQIREANKEQKAKSSNVDRDDVTWQDLSHCIDRWCFVISIFIKILLPIVFMTVMKAKS